jgi:hypothetical protein
MFFFEEARECFNIAFEKNRKTEAVKAVLYVDLLRKNEEDFKAFVNKYLIPPDLVEEVKATFDKEASSNQVTSFRSRVESVYEKDPSSLASLVGIWENEYEKNSGI